MPVNKKYVCRSSACTGTIGSHRSLEVWCGERVKRSEKITGYIKKSEWHRLI
jgi:hypothetical protein